MPIKLTELKTPAKIAEETVIKFLKKQSKDLAFTRSEVAEACNLSIYQWKRRGLTKRLSKYIFKHCGKLYFMNK